MVSNCFKKVLKQVGSVVLKQLVSRPSFNRRCEILNKGRISKREAQIKRHVDQTSLPKWKIASDSSPGPLLLDPTFFVKNYSLFCYFSVSKADFPHIYGEIFCERFYIGKSTQLVHNVMFSDLVFETEFMKVCF